MPGGEMRGMSRSVSPRPKESVVIVCVQVMDLYEPHQMHGVQAPWEAAIRLVNVITDRLGACDAFVADADRAGAMLRVGYQIGHTFRRRGFFADEWREERVHRSVHAREVGRTVTLKDVIDFLWGSQGLVGHLEPPF